MAVSKTLIRNARIVDGTGAPWYRGDVLIEGGKIAAVGPHLDGAGAEVVEADERYLAPGFIDTHTHDDLMYLRQPDRREKVAQGVTTVVVGNCSFGLFPHVAGREGLLRDHFASLLGPVREGESFADFAGYRTALEKPGIAINLVSLVGHASLRLAVMGWESRPATAAEREAMASLLDTQLREGAHGLSIGLVYPPSAWADEAELLALAEVVARHDALLAAHVRSYERELPQSIEEYLALLKKTGARGLLSHLQAAGRPYWGTLPKAIAMLEKARAEGVDVSFDMYPYPAGSSTILQLLPPSAQEGGIEALLAKLADPAQKAALRQAVDGGSSPHDAGWESKVCLIGWENVRIGGVVEQSLRVLEGRSLADIAKERGEAPFDTLAWIIVQDRGRTNAVMFQLSEDDLRAALTHPLHMLGSDGLPREGGKPHPRAFGSFPRFLARCARERGWFAIEEAVRHMTAVPAQRFGLSDRGLVRPGMAADLVLFAEDVMDGATFEEPTLPPTGIADVAVAGKFLLRDGKPTGARPGRVLTRN